MTTTGGAPALTAEEQKRILGGEAWHVGGVRHSRNDRFAALARAWQRLPSVSGHRRRRGTTKSMYRRLDELSWRLRWLD